MACTVHVCVWVACSSTGTSLIRCLIHVTMSQYVEEKDAEKDIYGEVAASNNLDILYLLQFSHTHLTHTSNVDFICSDMDFRKLFDCKLIIHVLHHHNYCYCVSLFLFSLMLYYLLFRCQVNSYQGR